MFNTLRRDIQSIFDRDPAARSTGEILLCYPGLHAVWGHRVSHWLWTHGHKLWARWVSQTVRGFTGIEIHPGATIGPGFFIDHGMGVVIGETAEIGANVTLYHGVTLGGTSVAKGKRHPTLGDNVVVGTGAKVLGAITIGEGCRRSVTARPDMEHTLLPDMIGQSVISLMSRMDALEQRIAGYERVNSTPHLPERGVWHGEDFSI